VIVTYRVCIAAAIILIPLAILYNNFWPAVCHAYSTAYLKGNGSDSSIPLNNITGKVSLTDEVNLNNIPSLKTTPRPLISEGTVTNSKEQEQYLTRNYTKYVIAKEQAEKVRPEDNSPKTAKVIGIQHIVSLHNTTNNNPLNDNDSIKELRPFTIVGGGFDGLSQLCCIPPDIQLTVSSKYVMETVNSEAAIYNKTSGKLLKKFGLESLFDLPPRDSPASHAITDPVLLFDYKDNGSKSSSSLRWFISISDITTHSIHLAISKTDNPTGIWRIYDFPFRSEYDSCSDQPFVGISNDKVVISVNTWSNNCNWLGSNGNENISPKFRGVQFAIADKDDLVAGAAHVRSMQSLPDTSYFSLRPALDLSATTALFLVTTDDFNRDRIRILTIDGPISSLQVDSPISVAIHNTDIAPDGIQPITFSSDNNNDNNNNQNNYGNNNNSTGTSAQQQSTEESIPLLQLNRVKERHPEYFVHTGDARAQSPFWYKGRLWLALNVGCNISGDQIKRSCIRIIEFDTNSSKIMLDFNLGSRGASLYYPALSVGKSENNIGIIIGYSSSSVSVSGFNSSHGTYPSLLVGNASTNDDNNVANSIKYFEFLKKGSANALSTRYGDYFSAALDPTESQSIWVAGQYHHHHYPSGTAWSTYIGKIVQQKISK
jgi:hypothetical protein